MAVTWATIKSECRDALRDPTGTYIGDTELLRMLRRVLRLIDNPEAYTFQEQTYTLTLTGASQYDLDSLIPGWKRILTITNTLQGSSSNAIPIELQPMGLKDFQLVTDRYCYTIYNNRYLQIYSPTAAPLSGTLNIIWYTSYLVRDASTNDLKALPTVDNDYFIIPDHYCDLITEGMEILGWRKDRSNKDDLRDAKQAFAERRNELIETYSLLVDVPHRTMMGAF